MILPYIGIDTIMETSCGVKYDRKKRMYNLPR